MAKSNVGGIVKRLKIIMDNPQLRIFVYYKKKKGDEKYETDYY